MKLTDQLTARVRARRVVEAHLLGEERRRPADPKLRALVASWFCDRPISLETHP